MFDLSEHPCVAYPVTHAGYPSARLFLSLFSNCARDCTLLGYLAKSPWGVTATPNGLDAIPFAMTSRPECAKPDP